MRFRKIIATAVAGVALATAAVTATPSPATAAGSGCLTKPQSGWSLGVCISENVAQTTVSSNLYVNTRGGLGSRCYIVIKMYRGTVTSGTLSEITSRTDNCYLGLHPTDDNLRVAKTPGYRYIAYAAVVVNSVRAAYHYSPYIT
ncbi:MAG TPA: hypothetical protein VES42_17400 [Pilimelia sp.]|nr:hypothetical protein [Pilimelia sp.]